MILYRSFEQLFRMTFFIRGEGVLKKVQNMDETLNAISEDYRIILKDMQKHELAAGKVMIKKHFFHLLPELIVNDESMKTITIFVKN